MEDQLDCVCVCVRNSQTRKIDLYPHLKCACLRNRSHTNARSESQYLWIRQQSHLKSVGSVHSRVRSLLRLRGNFNGIGSCAAGHTGKWRVRCFDICFRDLDRM